MRESLLLDRSTVHPIHFVALPPNLPEAPDDIPVQLAEHFNPTVRLQRTHCSDPVSQRHTIPSEGL